MGDGIPQKLQGLGDPLGDIFAPKFVSCFIFIEPNANEDANVAMS